MNFTNVTNATNVTNVTTLTSFSTIDDSIEILIPFAIAVSILCCIMCTKNDKNDRDDIMTRANRAQGRLEVRFTR